MKTNNRYKHDKNSPTNFMTASPLKGFKNDSE